MGPQGKLLHIVPDAKPPIHCRARTAPGTAHGRASCPPTMKLPTSLAVFLSLAGATTAEPKLIICSDSTASSYNTSSAIQG